MGRRGGNHLAVRRGVTARCWRHPTARDGLWHRHGPRRRLFDVLREARHGGCLARRESIAVLARRVLCKRKSRSGSRVAACHACQVVIWQLVWPGTTQRAPFRHPCHCKQDWAKGLSLGSAASSASVQEIPAVFLRAPSSADRALCACSAARGKGPDAVAAEAGCAGADPAAGAAGDASPSASSRVRRTSSRWALSGRSACATSASSTRCSAPAAGGEEPLEEEYERCRVASITRT